MTAKLVLDCVTNTCCGTFAAFGFVYVRFKHRNLLQAEVNMTLRMCVWCFCMYLKMSTFRTEAFVYGLHVVIVFTGI